MLLIDQVTKVISWCFIGTSFKEAQSPSHANQRKSLLWWIVTVWSLWTSL